jgi:hypothetical protein
MGVVGRMCKEEKSRGRFGWIDRSDPVRAAVTVRRHDIGGQAIQFGRRGI